MIKLKDCMQSSYKDVSVKHKSLLAYIDQFTAPQKMRPLRAQLSYLVFSEKNAKIIFGGILWD